MVLQKSFVRQISQGDVGTGASHRLQPQMKCVSVSMNLLIINYKTKFTLP